MMKRFKEFLKTPAAAIILFVFAAVLIITGGIGGTRAALALFSEQYNAEIQTSYIGVSLIENDTVVARRDYIPDADGYQWDESGSHLLCEDLLGDDAVLKIGKNYKEELKVANSGAINEYVRVIVWKYWAEVDEDGEIVSKRQDLDSDLIDLHFLTDGSGWILSESDADAFSKECTVLYYTEILEPGDETILFADTLRIDDQVAVIVSETKSKDETGATVITMVYEYDGKQFVIEAEADAVQTHNAEDAILSAWGKHATFSGDTIVNIQ